MITQASAQLPRYTVVHYPMASLCAVVEDGRALQAYSGLWAVMENERPIAYCPAKTFALVIAAALNTQRVWLAGLKRFGWYQPSGENRTN